MALWSDIATWRGPVLHHSGTITHHMYVVLHTADGSFEGTIAWQKNPNADNSSHFVVAKDGRIAQVNDTANRSGAQIEGNPYSIAVENEGNENTPLTAAQIEANARILAKAHQVHGIPLQLTGRVGTPGLGHHSMGAESGVRWGHSQCPGNIIKGQKAAILARAVQIVGGNPPTPAPTPPSTGEPTMFLIKAAGNATVFLSDGGHTTGIDGPLFDYLKTRLPFYEGVEPKYFTQMTTFAKDTPAALTLTDAQVQTLAAELNLTPEAITAAARKAINAALDDNPAT